MDEKYDYQGIDLTPEIIQKIIINLFNNQKTKRIEIINKVIDFHKSKGGKITERDYVAPVKKALSSLKKKGYADNIANGIWEISYKINEEEKFENHEIDNSLEEENPEEKQYKTYGEGQCAVYVYYYNTYKKLSLYMNKNSWPCKIGRTDGDPQTRILSQVSTAMPEKPKIEFIIKTDDSSLVENILHLHLKEKRIKEAPGNEWFDINPEEIIKEILPLILPKNS